MTAVDDDFTGYVGARWPALVRTAVLLGCPTELAPDVVTAGLARCRRGWRETAEHDDLEVVVHRAVLDAWDERLRESWWHGLRPPVDQAWPAPDLSALDRLTPEVRAGLVLRRYSALDPAQAVAIAGREAGGPLPNAPDVPALLAAAEAVVVYAPPPEADLVDTVGGRRRRWLLPLVGLLAVVLLVGGGTWWANRPDDSKSDGGGDDGPVALVEPTRVSNPAAVSWYAEGTLHLTNATYRIPGILQFEPLGAGAVYGDRDGNVVHLADDGTRTLLGTKRAEEPLTVSDSAGQVAWVTGRQASPRLVVYDLAQSDVLGELDLPPSASGADGVTDTRVVAFDDELLYYATADGWGAWVPGDAAPVESGPGDLYDVASRNRLFQIDDSTIVIEHPIFNRPYAVLGRGGQFSEDGNYVVTRNPDDGAVLVYDSRSGEPVDIEPPFPFGVLDATLAPELSITYLALDSDAFDQPAGSDSEPSEGAIVTCRVDRLSLGECGETVTFVVRSEAPVLGR